MSTLRRHSESYGATGGLAAEGVLNQLGRPDIDPLEVLVREAVQNCWDAKRPDQASVGVEIGRLRLSDRSSRSLREDVLVDPPTGLDLRRHLAARPTLLYFADFGTSGLGGPTRGDRAVERTDADFADFVFNIGQPPDKELGGGSFGYGKAAFFIASAAHTIIIDTLCEVDGGPERRLIACALGEGFVEDGVPFTGRHWWGGLSDGAPGPLIGPRAAELSAGLGLPARRSLDDRGTTIAILAPDLNPSGGMTTSVSMAFVAEALAWNFWPKMIDGHGHAPSMRFTVRDDGESIPVPDPRRHPRLKAFANAMDGVREEEGREGEGMDDPMLIRRRISSKVPKQYLGELAILRTVASPDGGPVDGPVPLGAALTREGLHHVALMRNAELVVRYLPGREPATGRHGYAGVFRCALGVDAAFRQSEPPTHDDWVARAVPSGRDRTYVNVALRRVQEVCREVAGVPETTELPQTAEEIPLGAFADELAALMPSFVGTGSRRQAESSRPAPSPKGAAPQPVAPSKGDPADDPWETVETPPSATSGGGRAQQDDLGNRGSAPSLRVQGEPELLIDARMGAVVAWRFDLRAADVRVRLRADVEVMTGDGRQVETDPPMGWERSQARCWIDPDGRELREWEPVVSEGQANGTWLVLVPIEPDTMVRIDIRPQVVEA